MERSIQTVNQLNNIFFWFVKKLLYLIEESTKLKTLLYEKIEQTLDRDYFMTAEQAKGFGLIDRVLTRRDEVELDITGKPS